MHDHQTILIYPSARVGQILGAVTRARKATSVPLKVAVGYNGPQMTGANLSSGLGRIEHLQWFGEQLHVPPYTQAVNQLMSSAVASLRPAEDDLIGYWSDDFYPERGWLEALWAARQQHPDRRFLCPHENIMRGQVATIPFATWGWWREHMGGLMWPPILKYVVDVWVTEKARLTNDFLYVRSCKIQHRHYYAGTRVRDEVDNHNEPLGTGDHEIIERERVKGFPVSWECVD